MYTTQLRTFHNASTIAITQNVSSNKKFVFNYIQQLHKKNTEPGIFLDFKFAALGQPKYFLIPLAENTKLQRREKLCFTSKCHVVCQGLLICDGLAKLKKAVVVWCFFSLPWNFCRVIMSKSIKDLFTTSLLALLRLLL